MTAPQNPLWSKRVINSALWAAYGDALGFITELATPAILRARIHQDFVHSTAPWKRKVGGKFGATVSMPSGCYSDDTQLRLAVSRAISPDGYFDVASFASVELPAWFFYALGAGLATLAAARSLSSDRVSWNTNFYSQKQTQYCFAGGNGAAMRIQPHVWSMRPDSSSEMLLRNVVHNCIITHGHPNALIGAAFHALCLRHTMETGEVPEPFQANRFLKEIDSIHHIIDSDSEMNFAWLPMWENQAKKSFHLEFDACLKLAFRDFDISYGALVDKRKKYRDVLTELGLLQGNQRGSGVKTAILASAFAFGASSHNSCIVEAANSLGSDTDTIATMIGALLGASANIPPEHPIQDVDYIRDEAYRLAGIRSGTARLKFVYPDKNILTRARNKSDGLFQFKENPFLIGLGPIEFMAESVWQNTKDYAQWQWARLPFGQTILLKRGLSIPEGNFPYGHYSEIIQPRPKPSNPQVQEEIESSPALGVNQAFEQVLKSDFNSGTIGKFMLNFADREDGVDQGIAFAALVLKAKNSRAKKTR